MKSVTLLLLSLCLSASAQNPFWFWTRPATSSTPPPASPFDFSGTGTFFFSPNTAHTFELGGSSNDVFQTTSGVVVSSSTTNHAYDASGQTLGAYAVWGNNSYSNGTLVATIRLLALQSNNLTPNAQFPSGGWAHGGIGLRYNGVNSNDFAGLIMLSAESQTFQIDDRSNGTELVTILNVPSGVTYGTDFKIGIENSNGLLANAYLWDGSGTLLTNYSYTFNSQVPKVGWPVLHAYGVSMLVKSVDWYDGSSNLLTHSATPWSGVRLLPYTNNPVVVTNSLLTMDSTAGGASGWRTILSPANYTNVTVTGTMYRNSGRLGGIVLRSDANAQNCYFACYDNNTTVCTIRSGPPEAPTTLNTSSTVTLTAGTGYPFTVTANATNLSWTINGVTVTATNSTLTSGLVGLMDLNGSFSFSNVVATPLP